MGFFAKLFGSSTNKEEETVANLNIGIILGSTRQGRLSPQVGEWVKSIADKRGDANYDISLQILTSIPRNKMAEPDSNE